ncbi:MAG: DUF4339 domain-containing protein [Verrucomicrobiota bacterium]
MNATQQDAWFYTRGGERTGPVTFSELQMKAAESNLNPRLDMVWRQGMDEWKPAGEIDGLFEKRAAPEKIEKPLAVPAAPRPAILPAPPMPPSHPILATVSLPFALLGVAVGWALFWLLHDFLWSLAPNSTISIPWVVLVFVFCGIGYMLGKPLGFWLRKSGFEKRSGARLVCIMLVLAAAVVGEFIYMGILLSLAELPAGLADIAARLAEPFVAKDFMGILAAIAQLLLRFLLAIGAIVGASSVVFPAELEVPSAQDTTATS